MQTVYVDILIFLNMIIDFFLLLSVRAFLNINVTYKRVVLGSVCGSVFSLTALLPEMNFFICILTGFLSACIIVFVTFGKSSPANFIKRVCCFYCGSFIFAGIMMGIYLLFKPNGMVISNNVVYFNISPLLLIILTIICYFILYIFNRLFKKQAVLMKLYNVKVNINNQFYSFCARVDTACDLKEPFSGNPVIVAEKSLFKDLSLSEEKTRIIPFSSLGGEGIIKGIKPMEVYINNKKLNSEIYIGFCENILSGEIKALIPNDIAGDELK